MIDHTHNPAAKSWVDGSDEHPVFPVQNLPLGVFSREGGEHRIGSAVGDFIIDLTGLSENGFLPDNLMGALRSQSLNAIFALSHEYRTDLRHALFALLTSSHARAKVEPYLVPSVDCVMHLPCKVGDYTDFYVGIHHAMNIGKQFRPDNPLLPNYKYIPIGYHGRASSIRVSGSTVVRPAGQRKVPGTDEPVYSSTEKLDYELEMGVWIGGENELGKPVPIDQASSRLAGLCLLNDWSARDLQAWEYQPLGPFLAKNFHTTVSPWVITADALAPFFVAQPQRPAEDPRPLPYLWSDSDQASGAIAITLEVSICSARMREQGLPPMQLSSGPATNMYWTLAQMITHHTSGGCNLMPGDLLGTGTISGPKRASFGSLMEISEGGKASVELPTGETRTFLLDGDEVIISAGAAKAGFRSIGFGFCSGTIADQSA